MGWRTLEKWEANNDAWGIRIHDAEPERETHVLLRMAPPWKKRLHSACRLRGGCVSL